MEAISSFLLAIGANIVTPIFANYCEKISDPIKAKIVKSKLDTLSATAFISMEDYLRTEISGKDQESKINRLLCAVDTRVKQLSENSAAVFDISSDPQRFVENEIATVGYPQEITEDGTTTPYVHLLSMCVQLLLEIPDVMHGWEREAWNATFSKLDYISQNVDEQTQTVLQVAREVSSLVARKVPADQAMASLKSALRQAEARSTVEMRGLSRAQAAPLKLQSIFVAPQVSREKIDSPSRSQPEFIIETEDELIKHLTLSGRLTRLIGPAGSGKTTLVRWLEQWHWGSTQKIAVRCSLRVIAKRKSLPSALELFELCIPAEVRGTLTREDFANWINNASVAIIFDGFDEVSPPRRTEVADWIKSCIASVNKRNTFVVTSRKLTTSHMDDCEWNDDGALNVDGFDKERVEKYIDNWQEHMLSPEEKEQLEEDERPGPLSETFTNAETIRELTSNPLLLSTLMVVHRFEGKKLPNSRSDLYRIYVDGMLGQWYEQATSKEGVRLTAEQMRRFLTILAVRMQSTGVTSVAERKAVNWINANNNTSYYGKNILEHMLERTGLLIGPGEYQFAHKSIGEFLVAEAIISERFRSHDNKLIDRLHLLKQSRNDTWRVVLFLWAGLVPSLSDLLDFTSNLVDRGDVQIALGLLGDRMDNLIDDCPNELEELLLRIIHLPRKDCKVLDSDGPFAFYISCNSLLNEYPHHHRVDALMQLSISGVDHFLSFTALEKAYDKGLLGPEKIVSDVRDSGIYMHLWYIWVRCGVSIELLADKRPAGLSDDALVMLLIRYRSKQLSEEFLGAEDNQLFFEPFIIDWLIDCLKHYRHLSLFGDATVIQKYLESKPFDTWDDHWLLAPFSSPSDQNDDQGEFDAEIGLPRVSSIASKAQSRSKENIDREVGVLRGFSAARRARIKERKSEGVLTQNELGATTTLYGKPVWDFSFSEIYGGKIIEKTLVHIKNDIESNGILRTRLF
ncbi:NACHT domain-containing NTPase [Sulfitobacter sp. W074]|uniref:NACHT domain-containing protein n=1 Tax=Sulfitobacter sp. W074 TaxID=2867026 RepID=UPI0021A74183|nr:NACHT domain-containing protein [Sulfitobacter sp. W074]UWR38645.1 NACHT domain-containing protein [Sulfitobacter sp. W074]